MKKNVLWIVCLALLSSYGKAQYFKAKYVQDPVLGGTGMNGMATISTGPGHVLGGLRVRTWNSGACNDWGIFVARTNEQGGFTGLNQFNNTYYIYDGPNQMRVSSSQVVEYKDGTGYGVIFTLYPLAAGISCGNPPGTMNVLALGFMRLDVFGNPMYVYSYDFPITGHQAQVTGIRESVNAAGDILATGPFESGEATKTWAIRVDQAGNLIWGKLYQSGTDALVPADIIDQSVYPEAVVIGTRFTSGGLFDGFMLHLDINTGWAMACGIYDDIGMTDEFNSITLSNDPLSTGYAIAGLSRQRPFFVKTDFAGSLIWWRLYGGYTVFNMYGIAERVNTSGNYEYYLGGTASSSKSDVVVLKVDDSGNPVNPAFFIYDMGGEEHLQSLDVTNGTAYDGISMYGVVEGQAPTPTTIREGFIIKAYFNGVLNCGENIFDAKTIPAQVSQGWIGIASQNITPADTLWGSIYYSTDLLVCNTDYVAWGNNAKSNATGIVDLSTSANEPLRIFPNPSESNEILNMDLSSDREEILKIKITNVLGAEVTSQSAPVVPGSNHLEIDLGKFSLPAGLYQVTVTGQSVLKTQNLMINPSR